MSFPAVFELSSLNGSNGFALNGINPGDYSGFSVSNAGDVNGDGFADLLIGARNADPNGNYSGQSYVVFGKSAGFAASLNLSSLNGTNGFALNGINADDRSGVSVSSAGDVNGDGFADLLIGAFRASPNGLYVGSGQSYVVFGKSSGFAASLNLSTLNGRNGFAFNGINNYNRSGKSVSSAGDVNGDGFDDLLIGADRAGPNGLNVSGQSYVVFGRPSITLDVSPSTVTEDGAGNLVYTFTRTGTPIGLANPLTVNYTVGGIATNGTDYGTIGTSVNFGANSATAQVIVDPTPDTIVEPNETVSLTLASNAAYTIGTTTPVTGTITNDDVVTLPRVTLAVSPTSVTEDGIGNLVYTFTRTGSLTNPLTVNYGITGTATNGIDYANIGTSINFGANSGTAQVIVNPTPDTTVEPNETVSLTLASNAAYTIGTPTAVTGTITNDDPIPSITLAINPTTVNEDGTTNLVYTFTRTGNLTLTSAVDFAVSGTATLTSDYTQTGATSLTSTTGRVTFTPGQTAKSVTINPTPDTTVEANETVQLKLVAGTGYTVGTTALIKGTITNDDGDANNNTLTGGTGNDILNGLAGNDTLTGGLGNDTLTGGSGRERFVFNSPNDKTDRITDFVVVDDTIAVSGTGFGPGLAVGTLPASQFISGTAATTASQRFIYNNANGGLLFDADGAGGNTAIKIATLSTGLAITNADFVVI